MLIINLVAIQFMCEAKPIQFREDLLDGEYLVAPPMSQLRTEIGNYLRSVGLEDLRYMEDSLGEVI